VQAGGMGRLLKMRSRGTEVDVWRGREIFGCEGDAFGDSIYGLLGVPAQGRSGYCLFLRMVCAALMSSVAVGAARRLFVALGLHQLQISISQVKNCTLTPRCLQRVQSSRPLV
jgi:hypothetical protein